MAMPSETPPVDPARSTPSPVGAGECHIDPDGFFGSVGPSEIVIRFMYELETSISTDAKRILLSLERAFNSAILPELFSNICIYPHGTNDGRRLGDIGLATGISTKPDDHVLRSAACGQLSDGINACRVVQGGLTIYVDNGANEVQTQIIEILKAGMSNDNFLSADKGIKRVTFLETVPERNAATGTDKSPTAAPPSRSNLYILYGVLGFLAAIALVVLAVVVWRRQEAHEDNDDSDANEGSVVDQGDARADINTDIATRRCRSEF